MLAACTALAAGCTGSGAPDNDKDKGRAPLARIATNPLDNAVAVGLHTPVRVAASGGMLTRVRVTDPTGHALTGSLNPARTTWTATGALVPAEVYSVQAQAVNRDGKSSQTSRTFSTTQPSKALNTDVMPREGAEVGVAMPIAVRFSAAVRNRAAVEKRLQVKTSRPVVGAWHWISPSEIHYRPKTYWPAHTRVTLSADLDKVNAGADVWGTANLTRNFEIGNSVVTKVDLVDHHARTYIDGKLERTIAVTGGKPGWETRQGTKVIIDKQTDYVFTNEMIGVPESYSLLSQYAIRVTVSGEFLHTAEWSTGSQGNSNVSHGCVGMNLEDSDWLFHHTRIGDPVEVHNPAGPRMELTNGYGDWNLSWTQWKAGSALG
ncbi:L,D-transpeptidase [Actinopolymorpha singaporensis]|uniref:Lipoprotein-anchoring transpeptidase ErfK/SrfK n=1 Tax=Actinopolymorpha singaporensis TaxID=117157 RepID=A0A1H1NZC8_9ACTN|nr:Ig-like domain-containing protein [Actinopolymorpha singaporensis]SDS03719.1 Lipoprotein-anchoring transpeptidase ErfK/SrfK [Actinopolymorpha singaporensis]